MKRNSKIFAVLGLGIDGHTASIFTDYLWDKEDTRFVRAVSGKTQPNQLNHIKWEVIKMKNFKISSRFLLTVGFFLVILGLVKEVSFGLQDNMFRRIKVFYEEDLPVLEGNYHYPLPGGSWKWGYPLTYTIVKRNGRVEFKSDLYTEDVRVLSHVLHSLSLIADYNSKETKLVYSIERVYASDEREKLFEVEVKMDGFHLLGFVKEPHPIWPRLYLIVSDDFLAKIIQESKDRNSWGYGYIKTEYRGYVANQGKYIEFLNVAVAQMLGIIKQDFLG